MSHEYSIKTLCEVMEVSRAGYYKWLNKKATKKDIRRAEAVELVTKIHAEHKSHGYRWTAAYIRINCRKKISDNFVYKIYRIYGLKAETKHRTKYRPRKVKDRYPNLIFSTWDTVDRPRQVIVSDMTAFWASYQYWELTMYFDVFTKQILSWSLSYNRGDRKTYINGLKDLLELLEGVPSEENITVIHTDQGSVYSSVAYNELIKDPNIYRSMSRAGKPTDNPVNESLNGWIKEELFTDFNLEKSKDVPALIDRYIKFYNGMRPCYALGYDTPNHYEQKYRDGELEKRETFRNRILTDTPKFVQQKLSTSVNENEGFCSDLSTYSKEDENKGFDLSTLVNEALKK